MSPRTVISLALVAMCWGPDLRAGEGLDCAYVRKATADDPYSELATFANCAVRENGEVRIQPEHLEALDFGPRGLGTIAIAGQWYYVRPDGTKVSVVTWDNGPDEFSEGLARTLVDGKIAYVNERFEVVVPPRYDWGWPFENGLALVCQGCSFERAPGEEHTAVVGGTWSYIDLAGNEVLPMQDSRQRAGDELEKLLAAEPDETPPALGAAEFEVTAGGAGNDRGVFASETDDGGFVVVGATEGDGDDVFLVRADASGRILWTSRFGGPGTDWGWSVHETAQGYVVAGSTSSFGAGGYDCYLVGTDRRGKPLWSATFGGENDDRCWAMVPADGGFMVAGETSRGGKGTEDCYLVSVDALGGERWTASFGGEASDRCFSIVPAGDGWIVAGATFSKGAGDRDLWVAGVSSRGQLKWERTWGGAASDVAHWIAPTRDGNFLVTGYTTSLASTGDDPMLVKITPDGEEIRTVLLPYEGVAHTITGVERQDGGFCLTGFVATASARAALLIVTDADGEIRWTRRIRETAGESMGYTVQPTSDGGCVMTGHTTEGSRGGRDLLLVKIDANGRSP